MGDRSDSSVYIQNKLLRAKQVGIEAELVKFGSEVTQNELEAKIDELNNDINVDGIIVQVFLSKTYKKYKKFMN